MDSTYAQQYLFIGLLTGVAIVLGVAPLILAKFIAPKKPGHTKQAPYECGLESEGDPWVQFRVQYYVYALLFVIFDVEVAFFFPWAVVFGKTTELGQPNLPEERRLLLNQELQPVLGSELVALQALETRTPEQTQRVADLTATLNKQPSAAANAAAARQFSWIAFVDILVFFGVLLVGFAYLWKRGDLNWVRTYAAEETPVPPAPAQRQELATVS